MDLFRLQLILPWGMIASVVAVFLILQPFKRSRCPQCDNVKFRLVEEKLERIAKIPRDLTYSSLVVDSIPVMKNLYVCHSCQHKWKEITVD